MSIDALRFERAAAPASIADPSLAASWTWNEATSAVRLADGPSWSRGRQDERSQVGPGACAWTVDDAAGTWAPDGSGAVTIGTPIRARYLLSGKNFVTNGTIESAATGWSGYGTPTPTVARSTAQAWQGSASLLVTWGTSGSAATQNALYQVSGLVVGRTYTVSAYVYVPASKPAVKVGIWFRAASPASTTNGAWQRLSVTFTATLASHYVNVANAAATTSGDTCYVDGIQLEEGAAATAFTSSAPSYAPLWSGFVSALQRSWVNGVRPVTRVTGTDLMGWLARQETSAPAAAAAGIKSLAPVAWWPFDDNAGARSFRQIGSSTAIGVLAMEGAGEQAGTAATLIDGVPALTLAPSAQYSGLGAGVIGGTVTLGAARTYTAHFRVSARPAAGVRAHLAGWADATTWLSLLVDESGRLCVDATLRGTAISWTGFADVSDNRWHHVAIALAQIGATSQAGMVVYVDGVPSTRNGAAWSPVTPACDTQSGLAAVAVSSGTLGLGRWRGDVAHVAAHSGTLTQAQVRQAAGPGCSAGLAADAAVTALLAPTGVVPTTVGTFAATLTALDTGKSMLGAIQQAALAERGLVHATAAGGIEVQGRSVRRAPSVALTLAPADVGSDLSPQADDGGVANDATVTGVGQLAARRVDATSVAAYGRRAASVSLPIADVASLDDHAAWLVTSASRPAVRIGAVNVALTAKAATVDTATALAVDLSDLVRITPLPGAPSTLDVTVEGVAMRASLAGLDVTWNVSPQAEPDLLDVAAQGTLIGWWDARWPAGAGTQTPDGALVKTLTDLSGGGRHAVAAGAVNLLWTSLADNEAAYDAYTWPGQWSDLPLYPAWAGVARSTGSKHDGSYGLECTWSASSKAYLTGIGIWPNDPSRIIIGGAVAGAPYTVSAWVYVPVGSPAVALGWTSSDHGTASTVGSWNRIYWQTYADTVDSGLPGHGIAGFIRMCVMPTADGYGTCYLDSVMVEEGHVTPGTFTTADPSTLRPRLRYGGPGSSPTLEASLIGHVLPLSSALTDTAPFTLYAVVRPDALDRYLLSSSASSVHLGLITSAAQAKWRLRYLADGDAVTSSAFASPVGKLCILTLQVAAGGVVSFRHNGVAVGGATDAGITGLSMDRIGGTAAGDTWSGGIGAILAYGDTHSAATVSRIERALALMWGVTLG